MANGQMMPPQQQMPAGAPMPGMNQKAPGKDSPAELLIRINEDINKLTDMVSNSSLPAEDKKQLEGVRMAFGDFADNMLSTPGGEMKPQGKPVGNVPSETMGRPAIPMM